MLMASISVAIGNGGLGNYSLPCYFCALNYIK